MYIFSATCRSDWSVGKGKVAKYFSATKLQWNVYLSEVSDAASAVTREMVEFCIHPQIEERYGNFVVELKKVPYYLNWIMNHNFNSSIYIRSADKIVYS